MHYPKHVAIIPDGNRTRAKANGKDVAEAYMISYEKGLKLMEYTFTHTDIKVFTLRGLSTENAQKRPKEEFDFLMNMYKVIGSELNDFLIANKINFKVIGDMNGITEGFKQYLAEEQEKTKCDSDKYFVFGVNYGWRNEIMRWIQKLAEQHTDLSHVTEDQITQALELGDVPPVELIIRTKGDMAQRTSGFMSRRIGYAELYFTAKKCPELEVPDFQEALKRFDHMAEMRNYGK